MDMKKQINMFIFMSMKFILIQFKFDIDIDNDELLKTIRFYFLFLNDHHWWCIATWSSNF